MPMPGIPTRLHRHGVGVTHACSSLIVVVYLCLCCFAQPVRAAISWSGSVQPDDPTTWTSGTNGYIGKTGSGTLNITGGSDVLDRIGYIGYRSYATGEVTED